MEEVSNHIHIGRTNSFNILQSSSKFLECASMTYTITFKAHGIDPDGRAYHQMGKFTSDDSRVTDKTAAQRLALSTSIKQNPEITRVSEVSVTALATDIMESMGIEVCRL